MIMFETGHHDNMHITSDGVMKQHCIIWGQLSKPLGCCYKIAISQKTIHGTLCTNMLKMFHHKAKEHKSLLSYLSVPCMQVLSRCQHKCCHICINLKGVSNATYLIYINLMIILIHICSQVFCQRHVYFHVSCQRQVYLCVSCWRQVEL